MSTPENDLSEDDAGLRSGPWTGFFLDPDLDGARRWPQDLVLRFHEGLMAGSGADAVGHFTVRGRYDAATREVYWVKSYVGRHDVYYRGFAEIKGIWGTWELTGRRGGFHIWPEGEGGLPGERVSEAIEEPAGALVGAAPVVERELSPSSPEGDDE